MTLPTELWGEFVFPHLHSPKDLAACSQVCHGFKNEVDRAVLQTYRACIGDASARAVDPKLLTRSVFQHHLDSKNFYLAIFVACHSSDTFSRLSNIYLVCKEAVKHQDPIFEELRTYFSRLKITRGFFFNDYALEWEDGKQIEFLNLIYKGKLYEAIKFGAKRLWLENVIMIYREIVNDKHSIDECLKALTHLDPSSLVRKNPSFEDEIGNPQKTAIDILEEKSYQWDSESQAKFVCCCWNLGYRGPLTELLNSYPTAEVYLKLFEKMTKQTRASYGVRLISAELHTSQVQNEVIGGLSHNLFIQLAPELSGKQIDIKIDGLSEPEKFIALRKLCQSFPGRAYALLQFQDPRYAWRFISTSCKKVHIERDDFQGYSFSDEDTEQGEDANDSLYEVLGNFSECFVRFSVDRDSDRRIKRVPEGIQNYTRSELSEMIGSLPENYQVRARGIYILHQLLVKDYEEAIDSCFKLPNGDYKQKLLEVLAIQLVETEYFDRVLQQITQPQNRLMPLIAARRNNEVLAEFHEANLEETPDKDLAVIFKFCAKFGCLELVEAAFSEALARDYLDETLICFGKYLFGKKRYIEASEYFERVTSTRLLGQCFEEILQKSILFQESDDVLNLLGFSCSKNLRLKIGFGFKEFIAELSEEILRRVLALFKQHRSLVDSDEFILLIDRLGDVDGLKFVCKDKFLLTFDKFSNHKLLRAGILRVLSYKCVKRQEYSRIKSNEPFRVFSVYLRLGELDLATSHFYRFKLGSSYIGPHFF